MTDDASIFNLGNLKAAADIAKTFIPLIQEAKSKGLDSQYAAELNGKIADMQFALIDAQSDALASQEAQSKQSARIRELEQTIAEFENWEAEKARYKLVNASWAGATLIYLLRGNDAQKDEPLHYICPKCYNRRVKSILQSRMLNIHGKLVMDTSCPECESEFALSVEITRSHGVIPMV